MGKRSKLCLFQNHSSRAIRILHPKWPTRHGSQGSGEDPITTAGSVSRSGGWGRSLGGRVLSTAGSGWVDRGGPMDNTCKSGYRAQRHGWRGGTHIHRRIGIGTHKCTQSRTCADAHAAARAAAHTTDTTESPLTPHITHTSQTQPPPHTPTTTTHTNHTHHITHITHITSHHTHHTHHTHHSPPA